MSDPITSEAQGKKTATVEWRDLSPFEVPMYRDDWPFTATVAAEAQQWPTFLQEIIPPAALAEFQRTRPSTRDAYDLLAAVFSALGFGDAGESSASAS